MHVCMDCYEHYDYRFLSLPPDRIYVCPKNNCQGDVVELDELIAPTIILLNQKGYTTKYCCSGHWYENPNGYIFFEDWVDKFDVLPEGFEYDPPHTYAGEFSTFRNKHNEEDGVSEYDFVIESNKSLLKWAEALPDANF